MNVKISAAYWDKLTSDSLIFFDLLDQEVIHFIGSTYYISNHNMIKRALVDFWKTTE